MPKLQLATFGMVIAVATAHAQKKPNYKRKNDGKVDVTLSARTKPIQEQEDPKDAKPVVTSEVALAIEGLKGKFQAEQEVILKDLIDQTPDTAPDDIDDKADLYFRLGELYAKQQRYWRLRAVEA